jgi:tetratricopeptide (TPR) repeat protein
MIKVVNLVLLVVCVTGISGGCKDNSDPSTEDQVLNQPPFELITDSIRNDPDNEDLYFRRAVLLNKANFTSKALSDFQKAWSLQKDERYAFGISTILLANRPDSALLFLQEAVRDLPRSVILRINLARAYENQERIEESLQVCNEVLSENPEQIDVLRMKASLLERMGKYPESLSTLEKANAIRPDDEEINYTLAFRYAEEKDPKVLRLCDSLIKADSLGQHAEPYYFKGLYYGNISDQSRAIAQLDEAIKHDHNFKNAYIEKGRILFDQKKIKEAYQVFNLVMTISPTFADAYYWMGQCQEALGQKTEARLNYQRAYSLDKSFIEAKMAADNLGN